MNDEAGRSGTLGVPTPVRWVGGTVLVLALAGLAWHAVQHQAGDEAASRLPVAPLESLADAPMVELLANADVTRLSSQALTAIATARDAPASAPAPGPGETEVCGLGAVPADDAGRPRDMAPIRQAAQRLREQLMPALLSSSDEATRAAGLLLVAQGGPHAADAGEAGAVSRDAARARDELAAIAVFKGSPQIYAWAMRACQPQREEGVCRMLSSDQWAHLEPGNAVAWLHVAADARGRGDEAGVAEAMYRVSQAPRSDARVGTLVGRVLAKIPSEAELLARVALAEELAALESRAEVPLVVASQYCGEREVRDANRQQVCAHVAQVLTQRGSTLTEAALGARIGERSGWAQERVATARDERDALALLATAPAAAPAPAESAWSCTALARSLARYHELGRVGELAVLRGELRRSAQTPAELAGRYRAAEATRVASAPPAASAPP